MKFIKIITRALFIAAFPILLLTFSSAVCFNSLWLYNYGFDKYQVSSVTGLKPAELDMTARSLIKYFNSNEPYIEVTIERDSASFDLFTHEEKVHFSDVRQLVRLNYLAGLLAFICILSYSLSCLLLRKYIYRRLLALNIFWGSLVTILLVILMGIASLFDFGNLFLQFHYLAFDNTFWSAEGYMLLLFPGGFWFDVIMIGCSLILGAALISGGISFAYLKRTSLDPR